MIHIFPGKITSFNMIQINIPIYIYKTVFILKPWQISSIWSNLTIFFRTVHTGFTLRENFIKSSYECVHIMFGHPDCGRCSQVGAGVVVMVGAVVLEGEPTNGAALPRRNNPNGRTEQFKNSIHLHKIQSDWQLCDGTCQNSDPQNIRRATTFVRLW